MKIRNIFITILIVMACINRQANGIMMRNMRKLGSKTTRTNVFAQNGSRTYVSENQHTDAIRPMFESSDVVSQNYQASANIQSRHEIMEFQSDSQQRETCYPIFHIIEYRTNTHCPDTMEVTQESWEMTQEALERFQNTPAEERKNGTYTFSINIDKSTRHIEDPILHMFPRWEVEDPTAIKVVTMIVTNSGQMVGYIAYCIHADLTYKSEATASIEKIYVEPQFQRRGIAKALMRIGYADCVNHSVNYVCHLSKEEIDYSIRSFFQKCGFEFDFKILPSRTPLFIYRTYLKEPFETPGIGKDIENLIDSILETNVAKKTAEIFIDIVEAIENDTIVDWTCKQIKKMYDRFTINRD